MYISVIQAVLIEFLYSLCQSGAPWLTALMGDYVRQPLVSGAVVGLIIGDSVQGLAIGSATNFPFTDVIMVGSTVSTNSTLAGIVDTTLALTSDASPETAVSIAIPIGLLGDLLWTAHMTKSCISVHVVGKVAETGDIKRMGSLHVWLPRVTITFLMTIPVIPIVHFDADVTGTTIDSLSGMSFHTLEAIGGVLPAVGVGVAPHMLMSKKSVVLFFLLGPLMVTCQGFSTIVVTLFAVIIVYFYADLSSKRAGE